MSGDPKSFKTECGHARVESLGLCPSRAGFYRGWLVVLTESWEVLADHREFLSKWRRYLVPGGVCSRVSVKKYDWKARSPYSSTDGAVAVSTRLIAKSSKKCAFISPPLRFMLQAETKHYPARSVRR